MSRQCAHPLLYKFRVDTLVYHLISYIRIHVHVSENVIYIDVPTCTYMKFLFQFMYHSIKHYIKARRDLVN